MGLLEEIARLLGDSLGDEEEPRGVRPDYGLTGAQIKPSDLRDQLRNADVKYAAMPNRPSRAVAQELRALADSRRAYMGREKLRELTSGSLRGSGSDLDPAYPPPGYVPKALRESQWEEEFARSKGWPKNWRE